MPIQIHQNQYYTVAERVKLAHDSKKLKSITTEFLPSDDQVICKASVTLENGEFFTGTSAANPNKPIEKMSPYEVAETSAVGRALGFAGFGSTESIATADEVVKAEQEEIPPAPELTARCNVHDIDMAWRWSTKKKDWYAFHMVEGKYCFGKGVK